MSASWEIHEKLVGLIETLHQQGLILHPEDEERKWVLDDLENSIMHTVEQDLAEGGSLAEALRGVAQASASLATRNAVSRRRWMNLYPRRKDEAESDSNQQRQRSEHELLEHEERADDILTQFAVQAIGDLEGQVPEAKRWSRAVPEYKVERPWRNLTDQYSSVVRTNYLSELLYYVESLDRASIGIAGERGAGKTALMRALRNEIARRQLDRGFLTLWILGPTGHSDYSERDFLTSILAGLAAKVGAQLTRNSYWPNLSPQDELHIEDTQRRQMTFVIIGSLLAALAGIAYNLFISHTLSLGLAVSGSLLVFGPFVLLALRWIQRNVLPETFSGQQQPWDRQLLNASYSLLKDLLFDVKEVTSSDASIAGLGVSFKSGLSKEEVRRPFTSGQLVNAWDRYVYFLTDQGFEKVVVFVDEVDKLDVADLGRFMQMLRALFQPTRLFFLVPISEDAFDEFLVGGGPGESNRFDGVFDVVLKVGYLSYRETEQLLNTRIVGPPLPLPFVQIIYALSKGQPRESVRLAREMLMGHQGRNLSVVSREFIKKYSLEPLLEQNRRFLKSKLTASTFISLFDELERINGTLERRGWNRRSFKELERLIDSQTKLVERGRANLEETALTVLWRLKTGIYYSLTLRDTFRGANGRQFFEKIHQSDQMRILNEAREELDHGSPDAAYIILDRFRASVGLAL